MWLHSAVYTFSPLVKFVYSSVVEALKITKENIWALNRIISSYLNNLQINNHI